MIGKLEDSATSALSEHAMTGPTNVNAGKSSDQLAWWQASADNARVRTAEQRARMKALRDQRASGAVLEIAPMTADEREDLVNERARQRRVAELCNEWDQDNVAILTSASGRIRVARLPWAHPPPSI